jgi:hypothetical protein
MSEQPTPAPQPPGPPSEPADRRESERFPPETTPICRVGGEALPEEFRAIVRDLSTSGIGLLVNRPVKSGEVLVLSLETVDRHPGRPLPARVMHCSAVSEGNWLVGCQFVRKLSETELQALLSES